MAPRYRIMLDADERENLEKLTKSGKRAARVVLRARALLLLDVGELGPGWKVARVAEAVGLSTRSLENLKRRVGEVGPLDAIERKPRESPPREVKFGGEFEARLLALACSSPPDGRSRWTVRLLAEKLVELRIVPSVSAMTVHNTLKKMNLSLT